jgi:hypothetical protein
MLGKLLRYEFKALMRIMPVLYLALQVLAVTAGVNHIITNGRAFNPEMANVLGRDALTQILFIIWPILFLALPTTNLIVVILRFRDNFLKDEGYLMFTLPVPGWELAASKAIAALGTFVLTGIAGALSLLIFGLIIDFRSVLEYLPRLFQQFWNWNGIDSPSLIFGIVVIMPVIAFQQICLIYAAMTVSQMAPRFRSLAGFGVYLAVMIIVEQPVIHAVLTLSPAGVPYLLAITFVNAAFAALYLWCTSWLLKHTFNLE